MKLFRQKFFKFFSYFVHFFSGVQNIRINLLYEHGFFIVVELSNGPLKWHGNLGMSDARQNIGILAFIDFTGGIAVNKNNFISKALSLNNQPVFQS